MPQLQEFIDKVLAKYVESITDQIFLTIQEDHDLMHDYLHLVTEKGVDTVNRQMGKAVKKRFNLLNAPNRQDKPKSTLIQSHQTFFLP